MKGFLLFAMASVKFSALVNDVKGSTGGNTFQSNANGAFVRKRSKPVNKNTPGQRLWKLNLVYYSQYWSELSDTDRNMWIADAPEHPYTNRLGESARYTGFQWFMKINLTLESITALS